VEERGLVGLEARSADGEVLGRISEIVTDEESGEVTHVIVTHEGDEQFGEEQLELPISALTVDPEADFATFHADPSDEEPGDHLGDEERPEGYAPAQSDIEDYEHEGQFVTTPTDPDEAISMEESEREADEAGGWEDEGSTTVESGYPRTDVYIDPDTGEEQTDPFLEDNYSLKDDVEDLINDTDLEVRSVKDGVVLLSGRAATQEDLEEAVAEIMGLEGVLDVDTTDVDVG
jgi:sporulation protein YlmC with PRC-barrel domain